MRKYREDAPVSFRGWKLNEAHARVHWQVDYRGRFAETQCAPFVEAAVDRRGAGGDFDVPWDAVPHRGSLSQRR